MKEQFPKDDFGVIVENNGRKVVEYLINKGFLNNRYGCSGASNYYFVEKDNQINFGNHKKTEIKWYTLEQLKQLDMEKEIIGYKLIKPEYKDAVKSLVSNLSINTTMLIENFPTVIVILRKAGVLDIWFEPIYKEEKKLPKINGYDGKLDGDYIIYGSNCARFQKRFFEILEGFHKEHPQFNNNFSNQNRTIKAIKLDSGVEITMEQVKEIVEFLKTK